MDGDTTKSEFRGIVWGFYAENGRHDLPWRLPPYDPYKIMVSEIMLQQTQVPRVIPKYRQFLTAFPSVEALANAGLGDVLRVWSGLGYNRRAKYLHQAAQVIDQAGNFPDELEKLLALPGIGKNTSGAILAYAFNEPALFIETNIRTVYIHHFFDDHKNVEDKDILKILEVTTDKEHPREWYWALMDYGSYLKQQGVRRNHQSKHYTKQSTFQGSKRQIRGQVLRTLGGKSQTRQQLAKQIQDERLGSVLEDLLHEQLIHQKKGRLSL